MLSSMLYNDKHRDWNAPGRTVIYPKTDSLKNRKFNQHQKKVNSRRRNLGRTVCRKMFNIWQKSVQQRKDWEDSVRNSPQSHSFSTSTSNIRELISRVSINDRYSLTWQSTRIQKNSNVWFEVGTESVEKPSTGVYFFSSFFFEMIWTGTIPLWLLQSLRELTETC